MKASEIEKLATDRIETLERCIEIKDGACVKLQKRIQELEEENKKLKAHSNMLESENKLLKEECKARLEKIKELEK